MSHASTPIQVETGSRLHFGLFAFKHRTTTDSLTVPRLTAQSETVFGFGGIGLMLNEPSTVLEFEPSQDLKVVGDQSARVEGFALRWQQFWSSTEPSIPAIADSRTLPVQITVRRQARQHSGLGAGTQLALAVAYGLNQWFLQQTVEPYTLAKSVQRGLRSAVGTYGFYRGGFLVDRGKCSPEALGQLDGRFDFPEQWRILLIQNSQSPRVFGEKEKRAFANLPDIPLQVTQKLVALAREQLVPALVESDFARFSHNIYDYGLTAGRCFSTVQGGPFANPELQATVQLIRELGLPGVGQSSWGPTLFAIAENQQQAEQVRSELIAASTLAEDDITVTQARNHGVRVRKPHKSLTPVEE